MQLFQIKGFRGLAMFLLSMAALLCVFVLLPASFMMVLWNAVVLEGFHGPSIGMVQGALLWAATLIVLKLVLNPQISFEFKKVSNPKDIDKHLGQ